MPNFSHFWSNAQFFALAGLAPERSPIASMCNKERKHNAMGYLRYDYRFDLRSTVSAQEVKVYWV